MIILMMLLQYTNPIPPVQPIPPLGTNQCQQVYLCDSNGQNCKWVVVCK